MRYIFKLRRDTAHRWFILNPVLAEGEPGFEIDTGHLKVGDGIKNWLELEYFTTSSESDSLSDHIDSELPHPVYDDGPSLSILYENAKV